MLVIKHGINQKIQLVMYTLRYSDLFQCTKHKCDSDYQLFLYKRHGLLQHSQGVAIKSLACFSYVMHTYSNTSLALSEIIQVHMFGCVVSSLDMAITDNLMFQPCLGSCFGSLISSGLHRCR